ncbi:MAG: hypothetical protein NDI60_04435 [Elusimicrobiales bacterium]|nr:hypothetical protein [Elusimicrobiales bacterium]
MKKWTILTIVLLSAVLLIMQYIIEKKKVAAPGGGQQAVTTEPMGVALPAGATYFQNSSVDVYVPPVTTGAGYGTIALPTVQTSYKGACEGASLGGMLSTHDRYWGFFARNASFSEDETQKMYAFLADYTACQAAARTDVSLCDALPGLVENAPFKVDPKGTANYRCREKSISLFFEAYLAGALAGDGYCRLQMSYWPKEDLAGVSVPEYCAAAQKGPEQASAYIRGVYPQIPAADIAREYPVRKTDCGGDAQCLEKFLLYQAMKSGKPSSCPSGYGQICQALAERSAMPCEKTLQEMSKFYCATVARVKKASGGLIGLSKEEAKAELAKLKAQQDEAAAAKKQEQKLMEEVNKQVRETLKKK